MDSVMKGLMGQCPSPRIFGLEPPLDDDDDDETVMTIYCIAYVQKSVCTIYFDVGGGSTLGVALMRSVSRGIDVPDMV